MNPVALMRSIDDAWNRRDWMAYAGLLADDLVAYVNGEAGPHDKREHIARAKTFCEMFPDNVVRIEPYVIIFMSADGNKTCSIARISGKMTRAVEKDGITLAPTNREFDVTFAAICVWRDGQITEQREFFDRDLMFSQLKATA